MSAGAQVSLRFLQHTNGLAYKLLSMLIYFPGGANSVDLDAIWCGSGTDGDWHRLMRVLMQPPDLDMQHREAAPAASSKQHTPDRERRHGQWLVRRESARGVGGVQHERYFRVGENHATDPLDEISPELASHFAERCAAHFSKLGERLVGLLSKRSVHGRGARATRGGRREHDDEMLALFHDSAALLANMWACLELRRLRALNACSRNSGPEPSAATSTAQVGNALVRILSLLGRRKEATEAAEATVNACEQLGATSSDETALALTLLGDMRFQMGQLGDAQLALNHAVAAFGDGDQRDGDQRAGDHRDGDQRDGGRQGGGGVAQLKLPPAAWELMADEAQPRAGGDISRPISSARSGLSVAEARVEEVGEGEWRPRAVEVAGEAVVAAAATMADSPSFGLIPTGPLSTSDADLVTDGACRTGEEEPLRPPPLARSESAPSAVRREGAPLTPPLESAGAEPKAPLGQGTGMGPGSGPPGTGPGTELRQEPSPIGASAVDRARATMSGPSHSAVGSSSRLWPFLRWKVLRQRACAGNGPVDALLTLAEVHFASATEAAHRGDATESVSSQFELAAATFATAAKRISTLDDEAECAVYRLRATIGQAKVRLASGDADGCAALLAGMPDDEPTVLYLRAKAHVASGQLETALGELTDAAALWQSSGDGIQEQAALEELEAVRKKIVGLLDSQVSREGGGVTCSPRPGSDSSLGPGPGSSHRPLSQLAPRHA